MNKIAQRRGVFNKMREMINAPVGGAAEKFFNPQFSRVMEKLRQVDADARSIVAGKPLEGGDPGADPVAFKDLIKSAKSNLNKREYMTAFADLSRFHRRFSNLLKKLTEFDKEVNEIHHQFLVKDVGNEHLEELRGLKGRWASELASREQMIKEAGAITDFLKSWTSPRGRALRFYESRYENRVKPFRNGIANAIKEAERLLNKTLISLKQMATARAVRNPDQYAAGISVINNAYNTYNEGFKAFYNSEPVKQVMEKLLPAKNIDEKGLGQQDVPGTGIEVKVPSLNVPADQAVTIPSPNKTIEPEEGEVEFKSDQIAREMGLTPPRVPQEFARTSPPPQGESGTHSVAPGTMMGVAPPANPPANPPASGQVPEDAPTRKTLPYSGEPQKGASKQMPLILSHGQFYQTLESMSGEHPVILASFIRKYAQSIQANDPGTAVQLLQIAKSVRG